MTDAQPLPETVPAVPRGEAESRELTCAEVRRVLSDHLHRDGVRVSPLGAAHSRDVDAHVHTMPDPGALRAAGWVPLDGLLGQIGSPGQGRWAVLLDGRVVGAADLHLAPPPDAIEHVLARARRHGAGARERAELAVLTPPGRRVPDLPAQRWRYRARKPVGVLRRRLRRRMVVAVTGVDGAGKSTLTARLVEDLQRAGVPATAVWVRPGVTTAWLDRLARAVKRLLGHASEPGMRRAAAGSGGDVPSRRGLLGRIWTLLIVANFALEVWRRYLSATGVVVFDRHLPDAVVTLRVLYQGDENLWAQRVMRRVLPRAAVAVHLEVPAEVAVARKPNDPVGLWAVSQQIAEYRGVLEESVVRLDGQRPLPELALEVFELVAAEGGTA